MSDFAPTYQDIYGEPWWSILGPGLYPPGLWDATSAQMAEIREMIERALQADTAEEAADILAPLYNVSREQVIDTLTSPGGVFYQESGAESPSSPPPSANEQQQGETQQDPPRPDEDGYVPGSETNNEDNTGIEMTGEINADFSSRNKWGDAAPPGSYTPDTWYNTGKFLVKRADGSVGIADTEADAQTQTGANSPFTSLPSNQLPTSDDNEDTGDINQQVLDDLLVRNDDGTLNLSVVGILGAVFGSELGNQSREDLAEVLELFDLTLNDYDEEVGNEQNNEQNDQTGDEQNDQTGDEQNDQTGDEQNNEPGNDGGIDNQGNDGQSGNVNQGDDGSTTTGGTTTTTTGGTTIRNDDDDGDSMEELLNLLGGFMDRRDGGTGVGIGDASVGDIITELLTEIINQITQEQQVDQDVDVTTDVDQDQTQTTDVNVGDQTTDVNVGDQTTDVEVGGQQTQIGDTTLTGGDQRTDVTTGDVVTGDVTTQGGAGGQGGQGGFVENVIDIIFPEEGDGLAEALALQAASDYRTDALRDATDAELGFLRELMGRQDTFEIFRNLGLPTEQGNQRLDYELNKIRRLVDRELEDRYMIEPEVDILPLIQEVDAVDPSGLNQINVADLLMGMDVGMAPGAIDTPVNQIDPFNPEDPALRFLQDEGRRAIEASAAAQGRLNSGGTLAELQDQAIGIAATRAGELADIGRVQDTSQLAADQQFYSQLLGSGQEDFGRGIERLGAISDAQRLQDQLALEADARRFETEQADLGQRFDQSRFANLDAQGREDTLFNQLGSLIDIGYGGAQGLTGNMGEFSGLGKGIYSELGDLDAYQALQRGDNTMNFLGGLFGRGGI